MQRALKTKSREAEEVIKRRPLSSKKVTQLPTAGRGNSSSSVLIHRQQTRILNSSKMSTSRAPVRGVQRNAQSRSISPRVFKIKNMAELWFAGCLFLILLGKLYVRVSIIESSYQIENVRNDLLMEDAKLRELRVKKAMVVSPKELSTLAYKKLEMRPTLPQQIRRLKVQIN